MTVAPVRYRHESEAAPRWLRRFTVFVASTTLFLIFAGAMVTSTGSGLAVPDWPLSYGMVFPPMVGGIFYEHGHRMIAATVGFLTVIQAIWLQARARRRYLRVPGWVAVGAVVAQGVLGGLTVLFLLPPAISIAHAGLAEIFLCLNVSIAFLASKWFEDIRAMDRGNAPIAGTTALVLLVYAQILVGALMRHLHAGLAIPDFPLAFGHLLPRFSSTAVIVNFIHRVGGFVVALSVIAIFIRLLRFERRHPLRQIATLLAMVVPVQILLGAYTIWSGKQPVITSLHVVTGALTLALSLMLAITARAVGWRVGTAVRDYLELSKARIVAMVLVTTAAGFFFGASHINAVLLINTLIGTALVAAGTNALNQYVERDHDAKMRRTQHRPLPDGRISPRAALIFSVAISILGTAYLAVAVNLLTALLGAITLITYIFIYTPLKRISPACTPIGAIPGAVPPLMGWTAATGALSLGGWIAFAIVFLWQLPHFMAISWIYREDYGRAGFAMLSVHDENGSATARQALFYSLALLVLSAFAFPHARIAAVLAAAMLVVASIAFLRHRTQRTARRLFMTSNVYLVVAMVLLAVSCSHQSDLPRLYRVPNTTLISDSNKPMQLDAMKGNVTVYDFIFTNCAGTCPMMTSTMRRITSKIEKDAPVRFVSISVDPQRDTPAALRGYAAKVRNDPRWVFLTGDAKTITDLSVNGFKLAAGGSTTEILHSSKFAIADKHGMIRDYYGGTSDDAVQHVTAAVNDLLRED
ncbi:MAG TPA: heme o synthase [Thermoanaerobaculia bacterium]|nr:heme o synthase [Thermoanaerobaculia bacterium]